MSLDSFKKIKEVHKDLPKELRYVFLFSFFALLCLPFIPTENSLLWREGVIVVILGLVYPMLRDTVQSLIKKEWGVDVIALLAVLGTLYVGEYAAALVVLVMASGGEMFEIYAMARARHELTLLLSRAPTLARVEKDGSYVMKNIEDVLVGDVVLVQNQEVVPVDAQVMEGEADIDESSLTGEALPVLKKIHDTVYAGTLVYHGSVKVKVTTAPENSRYRRIVTLVKEAEKSKAPLVRMADRYSGYFTVITGVMAAITYLYSHDIVRVISVLVVATPCPLLLATPIAFVSGMSRASSLGLIIKDAKALEVLSHVSACVFDKTGTVTLGEVKVTGVIGYSGAAEDMVLRISTSLEAGSLHPLARALLLYGDGKHVSRMHVDGLKEVIGEGVSGSIEGVSYVYGKPSYIESLGVPLGEDLQNDISKRVGNGEIVSLLSSQGVVIGLVGYQDVPRKESSRVIALLHRLPIAKIVMATGDTKERAYSVASHLKIDDVLASCSPEDKEKEVKMLKEKGEVVAMIGDGINDAPALAASDVGIALGSHGETATSSVADVVVITSSFARVPYLFIIAHVATKIAKRGIWFGMGASFFLMVAAGFGGITPLYGALLQEGVDLIVIMHALTISLYLKKYHIR